MGAMTRLCSVRTCNQPSCNEAAAPFCTRHWWALPMHTRLSLWAMVSSMYDTTGEEPGQAALDHAIMAAATRAEMLT